VLESKIRGLQNELDLLMSGDELTPGLTYFISNGISSGYQYDTLVAKIDTTALSLAEARQEYNELVNSSVQTSTAISLEQRLAQMKVDTLSNELTALQEKFAMLYTQIIGLNNEDGGSESKLNTILLALNDAKNELETLENQLGYNREYAEIELMIAEDKVNNYNGRIANLNEQLVSLTGNNEETLETGYLVVGKPSTIAVIPERATVRNTLLVGAIAGVIIAWIAINFRWLIHLVSSSGAAKPDDDEE
jgi:DNA repair exonuclease SbcCD ATPase subunit